MRLTQVSLVTHNIYIGFKSFISALLCCFVYSVVLDTLIIIKSYILIEQRVAYFCWNRFDFCTLDFLSVLEEESRTLNCCTLGKKGVRTFTIRCGWFYLCLLFTDVFNINHKGKPICVRCFVAE